MWQVNCNYKRNNTDTKYPLHKNSEDTTEHVLEWAEITEICRKIN